MSLPASDGRAPGRKGSPAASERLGRGRRTKKNKKHLPRRHQSYEKKQSDRAYRPRHRARSRGGGACGVQRLRVGRHRHGRLRRRRRVQRRLLCRAGQVCLLHQRLRRQRGQQRMGLRLQAEHHARREERGRHHQQRHRKGGRPPQHLQQLCGRRLCRVRRLDLLRHAQHFQGLLRHRVHHSHRLHAHPHGRRRHSAYRHRREPQQSISLHPHPRPLHDGLLHRVLLRLHGHELR